MVCPDLPHDQFTFDSIWLGNKERAEFAGASLPIFKIQLVRERSQSFEQAEITGPEDAGKILCAYLGHADREHCVILMLDVKNRVIGLHTVSIGTLSSALVCAREVFKAAILANAASIILGHNHPSGELTPSPEDILVTDRLKAAGELLDIYVHDHIIVGSPTTYISLRQRGLGF